MLAIRTGLAHRHWYKGLIYRLGQVHDVIRTPHAPLILKNSARDWRLLQLDQNTLAPVAVGPCLKTCVVYGPLAINKDRLLLVRDSV